MKVKIEVDLKPFSVPNFVLAETKPGTREEGMKEPSSYRLSDLDSDTLWRLCEDFKRAVFQKAGKEMPPEAG